MQLEKAYFALMANLTRLLGALDHPEVDVDTVVQELKHIILLEVQLEKVNKTTNAIAVFLRMVL